MAEALTAGRERVYIQDFFDRNAFNLGAFGPEVIDYYAAHYSGPGGMKAGSETYRAFDQDGEDNEASLRNSGRLKMPTLFCGRSGELSWDDIGGHTEGDH